MIGLDLSTSPKLAVKWIILKWYYVVDLILDSIWIILVFYCKFCAFRIILFYIVYFYLYFIREKINQTYTITSLAFQVSKMGFFFSTGFYFNSKVIEGSHKRKNTFVLISGHFFSKCTIFVFVTFFSPLVVIQYTQPINNYQQW